MSIFYVHKLVWVFWVGVVVSFQDVTRRDVMGMLQSQLASFVFSRPERLLFDIRGLDLTTFGLYFD